MSAGRIVVGVDGSESSRDALRWAGQQARDTGAELVAVAAWTYPMIAYPSVAGFVPPVSDLDVERDSHAALAETVRETLGDAPVTLLVLEGHPAKVLIDAAQGAGLLVVGSRGHGGFVGALLGSVSQHVVAHAPCPVVVIRHPKLAA